MTERPGEAKREETLMEYVAKPISAEELFEAMEMVMKPSGSGSEQQAPAAVEAVLDRTAALAQMDGDGDLLAEMAGLLLQDCPNQLSAIRAALADREPRLLERAAHKLKGSLGVFGATQAFEAALRLEMLGKGGDLTEAEKALAALEEALERLTPALQELVLN